MTASLPSPPAGTWPKAVPLLILAGLLAYANSFTKAFVFDDVPWIKVNPDIGDASRYLTWASRPVVRLSLFINYKLGGLNPAGYHAFNLAIHILAGLTLYGLVRRVLLLPRFAGRYDDTAPYLAFAAALLWLVHPLQTQSVTYIMQRCESMMGLFYLFAFYAWVRGATGSNRFWYILAMASFFLSCGCKEVAVTLPPVLLIFDRIFLARSWGELFRARWLPFLGMFGVWAAYLRPVVAGAFGGDSAAGAEAGVGFGLESATPFQYLLTQSGVILHYLRLAVWPVGQAMDYLDWPIAHSFAEVWWQFAIVAGLLLTSLVLLFVRPAAGFVGFWFFAILAPTSSIMPIVDPVFEHRMYLSLASVVLAIVFAVEMLLRLTPMPASKRLEAGGGALAVATILLIGVTFGRNEAYRSQLTMLERDAEARPGNPRPLASIAAIDLAEGRLDEANVVLLRLEALPRNYNSHIRYRAGWFAQSGRLSAAELYYNALLKESYFATTSPILYRNMAWVQLALNKPTEAAATMNDLLAHQSNVAEDHLILAAAELAAGREKEARAAASEAMRLNPASARIAAEQARELALTTGTDSHAALNKAKALGLASAACLADGSEPMFLDTLALASAWNGQFPQAADAARRGVAAATVRGDDDWATALKSRLNLYEAGKPYAPGG